MHCQWGHNRKCFIRPNFSGTSDVKSLRYRPWKRYTGRLLVESDANFHSCWRFLLLQLRTYLIIKCNNWINTRNTLSEWRWFGRSFGSIFSRPKVQKLYWKYNLVDQKLTDHRWVGTYESTSCRLYRLYFLEVTEPHSQASFGDGDEMACDWCRVLRLLNWTSGGTYGLRIGCYQSETPTSIADRYGSAHWAKNVGRLLWQDQVG